MKRSSQLLTNLASEILSPVARIHRTVVSPLVVVALVATLLGPVSPLAAGDGTTGGFLPAAVAAQPEGKFVPVLSMCPPPDEGPSGAAPVSPGPRLPAGSLPAPTLALAASSDTGSSSSDGLTGNNMPTFRGSGPAGASVLLFDGRHLAGLATVNADGAWSTAISECSALGDGAHQMVAQAIAAGGLISPLSAVLVITIDTNPPAEPVIASPAQNIHVPGSGLQLVGAAEAGSLVTVLEGHAGLVTARANAEGRWLAVLHGVMAGEHQFRANSTDAAGNVSPAFTNHTVFVNGNGNTPIPVAPANAVAAPPVIAMAAGDIACDSASSGSCQQQATANVLLANSPNLVLPLGDNQYECGSLSDYRTYYKPSWGQLKSITKPAPGNHEYETSTSTSSPCYNAATGAPGYYTYFGSRATPNQPGCTAGCAGYYSYDAGGWHVVVINSNCSQIGGCGLGSPQETWLKNDLAAHPGKNILAYWHYPRFTSGLSGTTFTLSMKAFWQDLYNAGAELILNGHDHEYERFAPMDVSGNLDTAHGIAEIVVGTGGRSHHPWTTVAANSLVRNNTTFGALKLTLNANSYSWQFMPISGQTFTDSGTALCH